MLCYVVIVLIQVRQNYDSCRNDEKWSDSGQILKSELTGFAEGFDVGYGKR